MKKILAIILTVAALCLCMVANVSAAGQMELSMNVTSGEYVVGSGAFVTLEISIKNNPGIAGIQLYINYPEWLTPRAYTIGSIFHDVYDEFGFVIDSPVKSGVPTSNPAPFNIYASGICCEDDGVLTTITFSVDETKINASNANDGFSFDADNTYGVGEDTSAGADKDWPVLPKEGDASGNIGVTCTSHKLGDWVKTADKHYHECTICGAKADEGTHDSVTTCVSSGTCSICGYSNGGNGDGKSHKWGEELVVDKEATCSEEGEGHYECVYDSTHVSETVKIEKKDHTVDEKSYEKDDNNHWNVCSECGEVVNTKAHTKVHKSDADNHWDECSVCGWTSTKTAHTAGEEVVTADGHYNKCTGCSEKLNERKHTDIAEFHKREEATKDGDGNVAYWDCDECGNKYLDSDQDPDGKAGNPVGNPVDPDQLVIKYNKNTCDTKGHHFVLVPGTDEYHMMICLNKCGTILVTPHTFDLTGTCVECGHKLPEVELPADGGVNVDTPTQSTDNVDDEDDGNITVSDPEPEDNNPKTGIALSVIPALIAAAVVATKKH